MQDYFNSIADVLRGLLKSGEVFTAGFAGETSDFVRFNRNRVRQAGTVTQRRLTVDLINGRRHAAADLMLSGDLELDRPRLAALVADLRDKYAQLPDDPFLLYATDGQSSERVAAPALPEPAAAVDQIVRAGDGRDLVGLYAAGPIYAGFANSFGQRNWQTTHSFNFDWSLYRQGDKAVKSLYAGLKWDAAEFGRKMADAGEQLAALAHSPQTIQPGRYRVFMTPAALAALVGRLSWGGFGLKAQKTKQTTLIRMLEGAARLSAAVHLTENTRDGVAPNFQEQGFLRPDVVPLIDGGSLGQCLVSPRSSKEYGVPTNGANAYEPPQSLDMAGGQLPIADVLARLDTGVFVSNLHYLNYSDRNACRATGMTRFATFWVQGGRIQGPLNVMRFDETIYRALGENLAALTRETELILESGTYFQRSTGSIRVPGALIEDFAFTL